MEQEASTCSGERGGDWGLRGKRCAWQGMGSGEGGLGYVSGEVVERDRRWSVPLFGSWKGCRSGL